MIEQVMLKSFLEQHQIDAYYLPKADRFQSEYLQASEERLQWLTDFTGSAGKAIITTDKTVLFTDSRYTVQAKQEVAAETDVLINQSPITWLKDQGIKTIGLSPWLVTGAQAQQFIDAGIEIKHLEIDDLWQNRPAPYYGDIVLHPLKYAGKSWQDKVADLRNQHQTVLISDPASLCWLLNIRGGDVPYTPLVLGYCLVTAKTITVYCNHQVSAELKDHFGEAVTWKTEADLVNDLQGLTDIAYDKDTCPLAISSQLNNGYSAENPCLLPKAIKNEVEQNNMRLAHQKDGRVLTQFLDTLTTELQNGESWTELNVSKELDKARRTIDTHQSPSFPTIAGTGANGAIVHYGVTEKSSQTLKEGELFLLDSGGQYLEGTTDVTRTILVNDTATQHQKDCFTNVFKGHIALATAVFPTGTSGTQLDVLARQYLWQQGQDYGHGTGHGVGSYLSVHEGPQGISKRAHTPLELGMILSNEPGYYEEEQFGIRIENLVLVVEAEQQGFLCFETLTLAPIDERLINFDRLTRAEKDWLDRYHQRVRDNLAQAHQ